MIVQQRRLMAVHAHPDDESSKGAATLARYAAEGVDVLVVTCTGGERGDVLNPRIENKAEVEANMAEVRRAEMAEAAAILGVRQQFLGFVDSGLPGEGEPVPDGSFAAMPLPETTRALVAVMREFRPHVVVTYDETGGYPHPDHIMTNRVSVAAFDAAGDAGQWPDAGEPWQPQKLYYQATLSKPWFQALHDGMLARGLESAIGPLLDDWPGTEGPAVTTRIPCGDYFDTRDRAMLAHRTQVDPDHPIFGHPRDMELEVWPVEEYHLAKSTVQADIPEDDLFTGVSTTD